MAEVICVIWKQVFEDIFVPAGGSASCQSLNAVLIMDALDRDLGPHGDLEDDSDSSDDNSKEGGKTLKLPLVEPMLAGEMHSRYCSCFLLLYPNLRTVLGDM